LAHGGGKVGTKGKQIPHRFLRSFVLPELAESGSHRGVGIEDPGHVDANGRFQHLSVFASEIGISESSKAEQAGIVGIEPHARFHHLQTPLRLTSMVKASA
jgi:hypothetical protein